MNTKPTIYDPRERQVQVILQSREAADYCLSTLRGLATYKVL